MSILVCGDLHGRLEIVEELLQDKEQRVIFIGDYVDSFDRTREDQLELLQLVLDTVKTRDNVSALLGNHELSYLEPHYRASGWKWQTQDNIDQFHKKNMQKYLDLWIEEEGFLFTHAGVSQSWLDYNELANIEQATVQELYQIGHSRGGAYPVGGPLWCDYYQDFQPVEGLKQVFGHTATTRSVSGIRTKDQENYCIDCLDRVKEVLEIKDGEAKILKL